MINMNAMHVKICSICAMIVQVTSLMAIRHPCLVRNAKIVRIKRSILGNEILHIKIKLT